MNTLIKTKSIMKKFNIIANKRYGQNFLIDDNILENIISASDITDEDLVIEIGPGLGNLTEYILSKAKYAILVEIDPKMISVLEDRLAEEILDGNLKKNKTNKIGVNDGKIVVK